MTKPTFKDAQLSIRINSDILESMKMEAKQENISMADFILKLYHAYKAEDDIKSRLEALERVVFSQSQAA